MNKVTPSLDLNKAHSLLAQLPEPQRSALMQIWLELGESLWAQLTTTLGTIPLLQQKKLSVEEYNEAINNIYSASTEMLGQINKLLHLARAEMEKKSRSSKEEAAPLFLPSRELLEIPTLLVDDNMLTRNKLETQLTALGLSCKTTNMDAALQDLFNAEQEGHPFQIVVISCKQYDQYIAYLGRMMKSNAHLNHLMKCLALSTELMDYEKERAYFDGFACVLNLSKPERLMAKLESSWRGWSTKLNFSQNQEQLKVGKNRILLVEDDPIPQKVTQWQLSELGFTVDTAPDGNTALKLLQQNSYDLVFMDIGLPDISGLEVTSEFRKRENSVNHTPIIGLTIYALSSDEKSGLEAGMDDYLVKPLMPQRLKSILHQWKLDKA